MTLSASSSLFGGSSWRLPIVPVDSGLSCVAAFSLANLRWADNILPCRNEGLAEGVVKALNVLKFRL